MTENSTVEKLKAYILEEFLPGEDPSELQVSTELVTSGVLDSLAILTLVGFLEEEFGIEVEPHEADVENFNTLADIARLLASKRDARR